MTHKSVTAIVLTTFLSFASRAAASPFTFVSVTAGDQSNNATASGALSLSLTGNGLDDDGTASATAHADFGSLGVVAAGSAIPAPAFPTVVASARATFNDVLLIGGVDGEIVSVTLSLALNGPCTWTDGATGGFPDASCLGEGSLAGPGLLGVGVSEAHPSGSITFDWGGNTLLPIGVELDANGYAWNGSFNAAFGDTLHVFAFSTTPGVIITSESGHDYSPQASVVPVPEPGTALLL